MKRFPQLWLALHALLVVLLLAGCAHHQKVTPKNDRRVIGASNSSSRVSPGPVAGRQVAGSYYYRSLPRIEKPQYSIRSGKKNYSAEHHEIRAHHRYPEEHRNSQRRLGMERVRKGQKNVTAENKVAMEQGNSFSRSRMAKGSVRDYNRTSGSNYERVSLWQRCVRTFNKHFRKHPEYHRHYAEEVVPLKQRDFRTQPVTQRERFRKIPVRGTFNEIHEHRIYPVRQQPSVMQEKYTPRKPVPTEVIF